MKAQVINTDKAAAAVGPYVQAMRAGNLVYASGQLPFDLATGHFPEGIEAQTHCSLKNLAAVLEAGGTSLEGVIKTTVFLKNMDDFVAMNQIYALYFSTTKPARSTIEVARLPRDALVEIEAVAQVIEAGEPV